MKLIKSVVGTLAVLFSIQSIAAWATSTDQKTVKVEFAKEKTTKDGNPTCGGGGC